MSIEQDRVLDLIEYARQTVLLRSRPVMSVPHRGLFALFQHDAVDLPGVMVGSDEASADDEVWLVVDRLHPTSPPVPSDQLLRLWMKPSSSPAEEPTLRDAVERADLAEAGFLDEEPDGNSSAGSRGIQDELIRLDDFALGEEVTDSLQEFLDAKWRPWAEQERPRRQTIKLYEQLYTVIQQSRGDILDAQVEVVWAVGLMLWRVNQQTVRHPLLGRLVEVTLDPQTFAIEVRPRDIDCQLDVDWMLAEGVPGVDKLENEAKAFLSEATATFSPFDPETFEQVLRAAVAHLDPSGRYWQARSPAQQIPQAAADLVVTDTWVLFARPRSNSLLLQDLAKLKASVEEAEELPPAVAAVVTEPATESIDTPLPSFRGISVDTGIAAADSAASVKELYFPKPYNEEQVRIVQLLDVHDGVVVQGPPGTGKTHTIANVICHYLAEGKHVLVTSMKDPALSVLQEQLPDEVRPLAIALLSSEQDGMKQFEYAIQKIASEVQGFDQRAAAKAIGGLEETIDALHRKLAVVDRRIGQWAERNLAEIRLQDGVVQPDEAAREVVQAGGEYEWLPDPLGTAPEFEPSFSDQDIASLRSARLLLGQDIDYLSATLPALSDLPEASEVLAVHQDLSQFENLKQAVADGQVPDLANSEQATLTEATALLEKLQRVDQLRDSVPWEEDGWMSSMLDRLRRSGTDELIGKLEALGSDLESCVERQRGLLDRPVLVEADADLDSDLVGAVNRLSEQRRPFGVMALFRASQRKVLKAIRILGDSPSTAEDWAAVGEHLAVQRSFRGLALRWQALSRELPLAQLPGDGPDDGQTAAKQFAVFRSIRELATIEVSLEASASKVFPTWPHAAEVVQKPERQSELVRALRHHLAQNRLSNVWTTKEKMQLALEGCSGRVVDQAREFMAGRLGDPAVSDDDLQRQWTALVQELARIHSLSGHLDVVRTVTEAIAENGAPKYAELLRAPVSGPVDSVLPDNWRTVWRLRRLATHLDEIDGRAELKQLSVERRELETDLARAYRDVVSRRTWSELAKNASPAVRSSLRAYLNAIQKIGKGTGKRAVRYRRDARTAAAGATPAVPCWIMAHYRVSESLPPELGCFDLVVIDEASQSDLTALPALLRAKKVLIVGDDQQVSPDAVGVDEGKLLALMGRLLKGQVDNFREQMAADRSIYDLFKVVFASSGVMLQEHFRSVAPIIEYSKREFYNHELRPLRLPKASERIDPPLVDVLVEDGYRDGPVNQPEAQFIVDEIKAIVADQRLAGRSIGVVTLLGNEQAQVIWEALNSELGIETIQEHRITCGDARTFQGKERDIMFLSMITAPNEIGGALSRDTFGQRFNVAASRARDRMYLVRSVEPGQLSDADRWRRSLIEHFKTPFVQDEQRVVELRELCESGFERDVYDELVKRGYRVTPQVRVGQYRIDMVVEGHQDARLAIECDGDRFHGPEQWAADQHRQRVLERAGWRFWRCFASTFIARRDEVLADLLQSLADQGIEPIGADNAPLSVHSEQRRVIAIRDGEHGPSEHGWNTKGSANTGQLAPAVPDAGAAESTPVVPRNTPTNSLPPAVPETVVAPSHPTLSAESAQDGPPSHEEPVVPATVVAPSRPAPSSESTPEGRPSDQEPTAPEPDAGIELYSTDPLKAPAAELTKALVRIVEQEGPLLARRVYDIYLRRCGILFLDHARKKALNKALWQAVMQGRVIHEDKEERGGIIYSTVRTRRPKTGPGRADD